MGRIVTAVFFGTLLGQVAYFMCKMLTSDMFLVGLATGISVGWGVEIGTLIYDNFKKQNT